MITAIMLSAILNLGEISALPPDKPKMEARKRGKGQRGRKRGNGLR